jgi:hypothetical protein
MKSLETLILDRVEVSVSPVLSPNRIVPDPGKVTTGFALFVLL